MDCESKVDKAVSLKVHHTRERDAMDVKNREKNDVKNMVCFHNQTFYSLENK